MHQEDNPSSSVKTWVPSFCMPLCIHFSLDVYMNQHEDTQVSGAGAQSLLDLG